MKKDVYGCPLEEFDVVDNDGIPADSIEPDEVSNFEAWFMMDSESNVISFDEDVESGGFEINESNVQ